MNVNAGEVKENLTDDDVKNIIYELFKAEPVKEDTEQIIFPSFDIHIDFENHNKKLYYYKRSYSFYCYTASESYDIYSLIQTAMALRGEEWSFIQALSYVCIFVGKNTSVAYKQPVERYKWQSELMAYVNGTSEKENTIYDKNILNLLDNRYYQGWIDENISIDTMEKYGIKWYNRLQQIVIPIYDADANLIGTHCRNLNPLFTENGKKYDILRLLDGRELKFNTANVLYGLNVNKENIKHRKQVFIFESPKSVLQCEHILKLNTAVAIFGMNLHKQQVKQLIELGADNFVICLDRQYVNVKQNNVYTDEFQRYMKVIRKSINALKAYGTVSVIWDKDTDNLLNYKDSPSDKGKEVFMKLYKGRTICK